MKEAASVVRSILTRGKWEAIDADRLTEAVRALKRVQNETSN